MNKQEPIKFKVLSPEEMQKVIGGTPTINMPPPISRMVDSEATWVAQLKAIAKEAQNDTLRQVVEMVEELNKNKIVEGHPVLEFVVGWQFLQQAIGEE